MKKNILFRSTLYLVICILICFMVLIYSDTVAYQSLSDEHVEMVVRMAAEDITSSIENNMGSELSVSKSMATNSFLHTWIEGEASHMDDEAYLNKLYDFLGAYQDDFEYSTVFLVSNVTHNYYYQDGINKTLSVDDEHDVWYYNFIAKNSEYDIQIDTNEVDANRHTVFINFRMNNEDGDLLGVVGVAIELYDIQELISYYENEYDLNIYLINHVDTENSFRGSVDHFITESDLDTYLHLPDGYQLAEFNRENFQWSETENGRDCIVDHYNDTLQWNIIVEKNTDSLLQLLRERIRNNLLICVGIVLICIIITSFIFFQYNRKVIHMENIDDLTGLYNRKLFMRKLKNFDGPFSRLLHIKSQKEKCVFVIDIDDFKHFNDSKGHLYGDVVLSVVGRNIRELLKGNDMAARWGGDEFMGIFHCSIEEGRKRLEQLCQKMKEIEICETITLSIGIVSFNNNIDSHQVIANADKAMYEAKKQGKARIIHIL